MGIKKERKKNAIRVIEEVSASRNKMEYQADGCSHRSHQKEELEQKKGRQQKAPTIFAFTALCED